MWKSKVLTLVLEFVILNLGNSIKYKTMRITDKIKQSCEEIIRLCNTDVMEVVGRKYNYKHNPCPADFNEINDVEYYGIYQDNEGNYVV